MLTIQRFVVNMIEENCYVLWDETREAVIVDCGAFTPEERQAIRDYVDGNHLCVKHLLNTHGHFDHVFGNRFVCDAYGLSPELHCDEVATYEAAAGQMQAFMHRSFPLDVPPVGRIFAAGDTIGFGTHLLQVIHTPGHTPGGVCFYCEAEKVLVSGDSLFLGSIGRCDLPGGDERSLVRTLRERVLTLPEDVRVLPGHGPETTVGYESRYNSCLRP